LGGLVIAQIITVHQNLIRAKTPLLKNKKTLEENKMKTLRRLCAVFVLTLTLALSAFAGQIETGIAPPSPPPDAAATGQIETGVTGEISTSIIATDPATEVVLSLLQSLLSLF
jgi:hypothetical protein